VNSSAEKGNAEDHNIGENVQLVYITFTWRIALIDKNKHSSIMTLLIFLRGFNFYSDGFSHRRNLCSF